jgi:hypothetical protein
MFYKKHKKKIEEILSKNSEKEKPFIILNLKKLFNDFVYIKENKTDLIVMGSHGISGIEEILGSNTEK